MSTWGCEDKCPLRQRACDEFARVGRMFGIRFRAPRQDPHGSVRRKSPCPHTSPGCAVSGVLTLVLRKAFFGRPYARAETARVDGDVTGVNNRPGAGNDWA